jgi:hypothetical protein
MQNLDAAKVLLKRVKDCDCEACLKVTVIISNNGHRMEAIAASVDIGRQRYLSAAFRPQHNLIARDRSVFRSKPEISMCLIKVPTSRHLYLMQSTARALHSALYLRSCIMVLTSRLTRLHVESYVAQDAYNCTDGQPTTQEMPQFSHSDFLHRPPLDLVFSRG